jgi:hypothetical protein
MTTKILEDLSLKTAKKRGKAERLRLAERSLEVVRGHQQLFGKGHSWIWEWSPPTHPYPAAALEPLCPQLSGPLPTPLLWLE